MVSRRFKRICYISSNHISSNNISSNHISSKPHFVQVTFRPRNISSKPQVQLNFVQSRSIGKSSKMYFENLANLRHQLCLSTMEPARFVKSNRNKEILVDTNNYEYRFKDIQKDVVNPTSYWYCRQRDSQKCTAKAKTIVKDDQVQN